MVISYGISLSNTCISVPLGIFLDAIDFICLIDNNPGHLMNLDTISRFMFIGSLQLGHFLDLELRRFSLVSKNRTVTIEGWPIIKKTASMGSPVLGYSIDWSSINMTLNFWYNATALKTAASTWFQGFLFIRSMRHRCSRQNNSTSGSGRMHNIKRYPVIVWWFMIVRNDDRIRPVLYIDSGSVI